jgi:hypothetical protein
VLSDRADILGAGFSSANRHLVTPNASRATTPVEDIEAFDPSHPSLSPGDSILLPTGKIPGYLDVVLKALTLHAEARTSFITYASSPFVLPNKSHQAKTFSFQCAHIFFSRQNTN